jgi:hypothetical protein
MLFERDLDVADRDVDVVSRIAFTALPVAAANVARTIQSQLLEHIGMLGAVFL